MMNGFKAVVGFLLAGALLSCEVLLDPIQGRWNPADPKNTLVRVEKSIYPAIDGYIDEYSKDFGSSLLQVSNTMPMKKALLRFDPAALPLMVESATLYLYFSSTTPGTMTAYRIVQDWSPDGLIWSNVTSSTFYDNAPCITFSVEPVQKYYAIEVKDLLLEDVQENTHFGFLLSTYDSGIFQMNSSRNYTNKPFLRVQGFEIP